MDFSRSILIASIAALSFSTTAYSGSNVWSDEPELSIQLRGNVPVYKKYRYLRADLSKLKGVMSVAPLERTAAAESYIDLPLPDGATQTFVIEESPILAPGLAAKYPEIKTYRVRSVDDASITGRLDMMPTGFHGYLTTDRGVVFINPDATDSNYYRSFYKHENQSDKSRQFSCGVESDSSSESFVSRQQKTSARIENELLTYRLAVGTTYEYSRAVAGANVPNTQAEIITAINRVNEIFTRDLGISLQLIAGNDQLISTTLGGLPNADTIALLLRSQAYIEGVIAPADYDVGHIFSTGAGGRAGLGVVCDSISNDPLDPYKSKGVTGVPDPVGDPYYIDYVAHELGHQFGANHTFNGTTDNCGDVNRNAATAFEPGSGSTIMAYAGICGDENIQTSSASAGGISDDMFHAGSIAEILAFTRAGLGNTCDVLTTPGNTPPNAEAGNNFTIPGFTPFELTGTVDVNQANLTYQWDEMDIGTATTAATLGTDLGDNPLFRSFPPTSKAVRTLPRIAALKGSGDRAERLPSLNRTMNFRLTVRSQDGGLDEDDMQVTVNEDSGPFTVLTALTDPIEIDVLQQQVIEWNAACTELAPVNCANVDILLSTNGGATFATTLLAATPNDGEETVTFPDISSSNAYIKIACSDNIFFDINDQKITLGQGTGVVLSSTGAGGSNNCGTAASATTVVGVPPTTPPTGGTTTPTVVPTFDVTAAVAVDVNTDIVDSVDDVTNVIDVFQFTGTDEIYTFTLSDFSTSDLDFYLTNSDGKVLIQSAGIDITEQIRVAL
ncbi:MAG: hypothetical protein DRQ44_08645, partial [Gammaproteobacteria bacterium]